MDERAEINRCRDYDRLIVRKVYDECSKRECLERMLFCVDFPSGCPSDYTFIRVEYGAAEVEQWGKHPTFREINENYAMMKFVAAVPIYVVVKHCRDKAEYRLPARLVVDGVVQTDNKIRFPVEVAVYAPAEFVRQGRFYPFVESYCEQGRCGTINITCNEIELSIGIFMIIKAVSDVQMKVNTYGFCDIPPECDEIPCDINFCELFLDSDATPFPPFFPPEER